MQNNVQQFNHGNNINNNLGYNQSNVNVSGFNSGNNNLTGNSKKNGTFYVKNLNENFENILRNSDNKNVSKSSNKGGVDPFEGYY